MRKLFGLFVFALMLAPEPRHLSGELRYLPVPAVPSIKPPAEQHDFDAVLGHAQTHFNSAGKMAPRAENVRLVSEKVATQTLRPGEVWSFNATVGPRTEERGFKPAPEILLGELKDGVGGGTCQVSSTIFQAALLAGLDIVRRSPHSRPPKYALTGTDATVSYDDGIDLLLKNPWSFPIQIRSWTEADEVFAEVRGLKKGPTVKLQWINFSTEPFARKMRKTGKYRGKHLAQHGADGQSGALRVRTYQPDGTFVERLIPTTYPPVNEIWDVGLNWDDQETPWATEAASPK